MIHHQCGGKAPIARQDATASSEYNNKYHTYQSVANTDRILRFVI